MTREQFIAEFRHELAGMVLDAAMRPKGEYKSLSLLFENIFTKIDIRLGQMYDALQPQAIGKPPPPPAAPQQPPANGSHGEPQQRRPASGGMTGILKQ